MNKSSSLTTVLNNYCPVKIITCNDKDAPWMTDVINRLLKEKEIIYNQYVRNGYQDSKQYVKNGYQDNSKQYVKNGYQDSKQYVKNSYQDNSKQYVKNGYQDNSKQYVKNGYQDNSKQYVKNGYQDNSKQYVKNGYQDKDKISLNKKQKECSLAISPAKEVYLINEGNKFNDPLLGPKKY